MVTGVEIEFTNKPTENEIHLLRLAAEKLTKNPFRIEIEKSDDFPKKATVIFRMKNAAQYKAVEGVADIFRYMIPDYRDMTIWFEQEKAYDLKNPKIWH
jgi:CRISPR/Cas system-associated endonuclease Cas3-HD